MLRSVVTPWVVWSSFFAFFIFVVSSLLLLPVVEATLSSNPDDYDFGWIAMGVHDSGQLPVCTYCLNVYGSVPMTLQGDDVVVAPQNNENFTVVLYECAGVYSNEIWAYQNSSASIVFSDLSELLCLDALYWTQDVLKLLPCNESLSTQRWTFENHSLISGVIDSSGRNLSVVGTPPDVGTDPNQQRDSYPLFINSSVPALSTSTFTFLPSQNLVDLSTGTLTTKGLLELSDSQVGQVTNGDFSNSTILAGTTIGNNINTNQSFPYYFSLCGWVIDYGPIDYVKFLPGANGSLYSVHLNTQNNQTDDFNKYRGSISQTIETEVGTNYVLSFHMTGFPSQVAVPGRPYWNCGAAYTQAFLQVQVTNASTPETSGQQQASSGGTLSMNFTANVTNLTAQDIAWTLQTVPFTASTNVTTISFTSLNFNSSCGPMLDNVDLSSVVKSSKRKIKILPVVLGSVGGLLGFIAVMSIVVGISYFRAPQDYSGKYSFEHGRVYTLKELSVATKCFGKVLGEGGFGTVYKADFSDGTLGAVKVEKEMGPYSNVLASAEINVLLRVHHRNLVNLIGFCIDKSRHLLVFEYLPNGSLYDRLHRSAPRISDTTQETKSATSANSHVKYGSFRSNLLSWKQRVKIADDIACGLEYLHHQANPPIAHRDIKSHNILLTATNSAKLADFGLSKAAPIGATSFNSIETAVRGSFGYMDPQYFYSGVFSPKSDVYSFGVVLLELISGQLAIYNATPLAVWAAPYLTDPSLYQDMVDKKLNYEYDAVELESLVDLSKMCIQEDGEMRPTMRQVVTYLHTKFPTFGEESSRQLKE